MFVHVAARICRPASVDHMYQHISGGQVVQEAVALATPCVSPGDQPRNIDHRAGQEPPPIC
eukprot:1719619-Pleurochrysis_carterae.AAC.1